MLKFVNSEAVTILILSMCKHGCVQVEEDRDERSRELIDTSTEDDPKKRMEEGEVEVEELLRAEAEEGDAAEDGETAGGEEEEEEFL